MSDQVQCPKCNYIATREGFSCVTGGDCNCVCPNCEFDITNNAIDRGINLSDVYKAMELQFHKSR